jgi:hypothetical protein
MHSVHHQLQSRIYDRPRFFGIEAFNQGGGTFEVGEQCRDGLTFAVGGAA